MLKYVITLHKKQEAILRTYGKSLFKACILFGKS